MLSSKATSEMLINLFDSVLEEQNAKALNVYKLSDAPTSATHGRHSPRNTTHDASFSLQEGEDAFCCIPEET